jgi:hypothetical protein
VAKPIPPAHAALEVTEPSEEMKLFEEMINKPRPELPLNYVNNTIRHTDRSSRPRRELSNNSESLKSDSLTSWSRAV